mmetsp:Transcript_2192/g.8428  ORF Transcript_2192/g.8428 Transcript_2192/m.8428 type:complete len:207 (-) Transcript_2192:162-782(-)
MDVGNAPVKLQPLRVNSSRFESVPSHGGNFPVIRLLPLRDSLRRFFKSAHSTGIRPPKLFRFSNPASPRYKTSRDFIPLNSGGNAPDSPLADKSRCRKLVNVPNSGDRVPVRRLLDNTSDWSFFIWNNSDGISPLNKLSLKSRYRSSSKRDKAVRLNFPQHATLFRFIQSSVTRLPTHTTPCHPFAHGSPTPQFFWTLHRTPLHSS